MTLWFEVHAPEAAKRCEDTGEMGMSPNAEVGIELPELGIDQLVGRTFSIPGTKSDDEDSCMSLLYYCEHEPLRKNKIAVVSRSGDRLKLGFVLGGGLLDGARAPCLSMTRVADWPVTSCPLASWPSSPPRTTPVSHGF